MEPKRVEEKVGLGAEQRIENADEFQSGEEEGRVALAAEWFLEDRDECRDEPVSDVWQEGCFVSIDDPLDDFRIFGGLIHKCQV